MWADLADDRGVGDLLKSVGRDVMVVGNKEGICSIDAFSCALRVLSYSLAEAAHLIGVGRGPGGGVLRVFTELSILHELDSLFIEYWKIHGIGAGCVFPGAVSNGRVRSLWVWWRREEDGAAILGGIVGGTASVSTLEGRAGVCTGDGGGTGRGRSRVEHHWSRWGVLLWGRLGLVWRRRQEDVADAGEGFQSFGMQRGRYIFNGALQEVEGMDYAVFWRDQWLR